MNVVLISIDTLRFDCVSYQPDKRGLSQYNLDKNLDTPTLDSIAEKSLCFTNCFSTNTYTTSAHASMLTGLYPQRHGVRPFYDTKLNSSVTTLAELYKAQGYETVLATDRPQLFLPLDLGRGFNHVFSRDDKRLFKCLRKSADKNIFLFVHFFDVHAPYLHSETPISENYNNEYFHEMDLLYKRYGMKKKSEDPYILNRRFLDHIEHKTEILFPLYVRGLSKFDKGRFDFFMKELSSSGFLEDSLTVVTADHGEGKSAAGKKHFTHAGDLFDCVLRVPLMIMHPDIEHKVFNNIISIVDIFSTVLEMSGIKVYDETDSVFMGQQRKTAYFETWRSSKEVMPEDLIEGQTEPEIPHDNDREWLLRQRGLRTPDLKFVLLGTPEKWLDSITDKNIKQFIISYYKFLPVILQKSLSKLLVGNSANSRIFELSDREFVKQIYRKVFSRFEDHEGVEAYHDRLKEGSIGRKELVLTLLASKEYRETPKYQVYNLEKDPFEDHPVSLSLKSKRDMKYAEYYNSILELEKHAVQADKIWDSRVPNKEAIIEELKSLGYL